MMAVGSSSSTGNGSVCFLCRQSLAVGENGRHKSRVCFQAGHFATPIVLFRKVASTAWFNGCLTEDVDRAITVQTIRHRDSKLLPPAMPLRVRLAQSSLREPRQFPIETGGSDAYQTMLAPPYVLRSRASAEVAVIEALFINTEEWVVGAGRPYDSIYRRMERPSVSAASGKVLRHLFKMITIANCLMGTSVISAGDKLGQLPIYAPGHALNEQYTLPWGINNCIDELFGAHGDVQTETLFGSKGSFTGLLRSRDAAHAEGFLIMNLLVACHLSDFLRDRRREKDAYSHRGSVEQVMCSVNRFTFCIQQWGRQFPFYDLPRAARDLHAELRHEAEATVARGNDNLTTVWENPATFFVDWKNPNYTPVVTFCN